MITFQNQSTMYIGSDEDIMGIEPEEKGISTPVEFGFDFDLSEEKIAKGFQISEPKKKKESNIVIKKTKNERRKQKPGKSSNLF